MLYQLNITIIIGIKLLKLRRVKKMRLAKASGLNGIVIEALKSLGNKRIK